MAAQPPDTLHPNKFAKKGRIDCMKIFKTLSKRGLALFLVLTMCVSLLPATALAAEAAEALHTHNEDGWACVEESQLICGYEQEHTHDETCWAASEKTLACSLEEAEGHQHDESCYTEETTLACGQEESEEHSHDETCYVTETVLSCGQEEAEGHTHGEDCFAAGEAVLTCELEEHQHGEACYASVWTCTEPSEDVSRFLRAVKAIPEEITAENVEEAEVKIAEAIEAYQHLGGAEKSNASVVRGYDVILAAKIAVEAAKHSALDIQIPEGAVCVAPSALYEFYNGEACEDMPVGNLFSAVGCLYGPEDDMVTYYPKVLHVTGEGVDDTLELTAYAEMFAMTVEGTENITFSELPTDTVTVTPEQIFYNGTPVTVYFFEKDMADDSAVAEIILDAGVMPLQGQKASSQSVYVYLRMDGDFPEDWKDKGYINGNNWLTVGVISNIDGLNNPVSNGPALPRNEWPESLKKALEDMNKNGYSSPSISFYTGGGTNGGPNPEEALKTIDFALVDWEKDETYGMHQVGGANGYCDWRTPTWHLNGYLRLGAYVTYRWSDLPTDATLYDANGTTVVPQLPQDGTKYVVGSTYSVDETYTEETVYYTRDKYGNVNGSYTFSGWSDSNNGIMTKDGALVTGTWTYQEVTPKEVSYTVNYYLEGTETKLDDSHSGTARCGSQITINTPGVKKDITGYTYVSSNPAELIISDSEDANVINLYYSADEAKIVFDANAGSDNVSGVPEAITGTTGAKIENDFPTIAPVRVGYEFIGWYTDATDGAEVETYPDTFPANTTTYYAHWNLRHDLSYTVQYLDQDEKEISPSETVPGVAYGSTVTLETLEAVEGRELIKDIPGYTYNRFEPDGGLKIGGISDQNVVTLYYSANSYTVTYLVDGVRVGEVESYDYNEAVTIRDKFVKEGYTVSEWSVTEGFNMPANNVTITATTEINSYTVTYLVDGVQVGEVESYDYNEAVTIRDKFVKEGYTVSEWSVTEGFNMPAKDVVITATTTINSYPYTVNYVNEAGNAVAPSKTGPNQTFGETVTEFAIRVNGYVLDDAATKSLTISTNVAGNVITFVYSADTMIDPTVPEGDRPTTGGDGIPDKYQATVIFKVMNGTWDDDTTRRSIVVTLTDDNDEPAADGKYTIGEIIPSGTPNAGYRDTNAWSDKNPAGVTISKPGTYTYTLTYAPIPVIPTPPTVTPPGGGTTIPDGPTPLVPDPGTTITDQDVPLAAPGLNNTDHFDYIKGYVIDGQILVRPEANITRAEVATIFFRLMTKEFREANWATENDFTDVKKGDWYNNAISTCTRAGILKGYEDGTFKPNQTISREEFAAIAARFASEEVPAGGMFKDIAGRWSEKDIERAAAMGWIKGSNGLFRPVDKITRAEVIVIVNRMLDRVPDADHMLPDMKTFADNTPDMWWYADVQEATNSHEYDRAEDGVTGIWTSLLPEQDWAALEEEWATAADANVADVAPKLGAEGEKPEEGAKEPETAGGNDGNGEE